MNLIDIIGPDCEKIIYKYKKSFDLILFQKAAIIDTINSRYNDQIIKELEICYEDFKHIYLKYNRYNKFIQFTINCYGKGHYMNRKPFDLDFKNDKDALLYEYQVKSICKNVEKKMIKIDLYSCKYDYDLLDKQTKNDRMDLDDSEDSDLDDLIKSI